MLTLVILAAGRGTRMRNSRPKVLHPLAGRSLIGHVAGLGRESGAAQVIAVLAPGMEDVSDEARKWYPGASIALQDQPLGTGHAVKAALPSIPDNGTVIVLFGDTPLITAETIQALYRDREDSGAAAVVMGMAPPDPHGYGRLQFARAGELVAIVEHAHASEELRKNALCNSGVMAIDASLLADLISAVPRQERNGEYYLTDIVAAAVTRGRSCRALEVPFEQGHGVNSQSQLAEANAFLQRRLRREAMDRGVIMTAPETVQLSYDTQLEAGAEIEPFVVFGPGVHVASGARIRSFSHLEGARVGQDAVVGPYARLREGSEIGQAARIGNFVETKNAVLGQGAKANHLTYLGDCSIGQRSNIGAGTITCNYDGFNKSRTEIGDHVFVGSNTALVAPVIIGEGALIGAGSTITAQVPAEALAIARGRQTVRKGAARVLRERLQRKKQGQPG